MADRENRDAVAALIPAEVKAKAVCVTITMPENALREIDRYAEDHGFTRSGFLTQAARKVMEKA